MNIPGLTTAFRAGGAILARRILTDGAADGVAIQAAGGSARLLGVSTDIDSASGGVVDAVRGGLAAVVYGGTVARGDALTADSSGRAIAATLPVAADTYIIGFAEVSGVLGDIGSVHVVPGLLALSA
ncbi:DUF2190 domain-containing protein [Ectopseudomonas toyotomiensis]|uniref:DUF2190 domain-containing protein n=1 Tax=Ectopseudomonas toyotomiensis TaxID=554344 RepID=A0A1I5Z412_9GAMM|nr:DUF2190 domain-containing protein [Pseudomonas toyotomiensis]SFQ51209.1 hypothetical protein SAMN05216177_1243 [Pseudomonas toyotomiensis]